MGVRLRLLRDAEYDLPALGKLHRVTHEIGQHLSQSAGIAAELHGHVAVNERGQLDSFGLRLLRDQFESILGDTA